MPMPDALRFRFHLWSQTRQHQSRVRRAEQRIAQWLPQVRHPYLAFSGGKDSTCCLALVRAQRPETPAIYISAECEYPEQALFLWSTPACHWFPAAEPFVQVLARYNLAQDTVETATMQAMVWEPVPRLLHHYGFDGMCYGLRMEENPRTRGRHLRRRGPVFRSQRYGVLVCAPLMDWTYNDVWAYIVSHALPYCGTYDKLWEAPPEEQRLSYWAGETKRRYGRYVWLKRNYLPLWHQLVAAIPEVSAYA